MDKLTERLEYSFAVNWVFQEGSEIGVEIVDTFGRDETSLS